MINKIVVFAASAGGLKALKLILSTLPKDFAAPVAVVQHIHPHHRSIIANILNAYTLLSVKQAEAGDILQKGTVYIAPPNLHLVINSDYTLSLLNSEKVHFVRPAGDVLFKSAAMNFSTQVIAVVLTGMDSDGAAGVELVKRKGGTVIVQDETTSEFFAMPKAAIKTGCVDFILPLNAIAMTLVDLISNTCVYPPTIDQE